MIRNILLVIAYLFVQVTYSQNLLNPSSTLVDLIQKSPMLIVQDDSAQNVLQRQENQNTYKMLSPLLKTYWKYSQFEDNNKYFNEDDTTQAFGIYVKKIMAYDWLAERVLVRSTFKEYNPMKNRYEVPRDRYKTQMKQVQYGNTAIMFIYDLLSNQNVLSVYLPDTVISQTNYIYGIKLLQYELNYLKQNKDKNIDYLLTKEVEKNVSELKNMTLLIDKAETELKEKDIQKIYPYKYQLVGSGEIEKAFLKESSDKAIMKMINLAAPLVLKIKRICVIMNPSNGKIYMYDVENTKDIRIFNSKTTRVPTIDKKQLVKLTKMIK